MFYSKWSPSPKTKSLLAHRAANDQPLFLKGLAGSPKVAKASLASKASPAKGKTDPAAQSPKGRAWDHAEPKQIIRTFTY